VGMEFVRGGGFGAIARGVIAIYISVGAWATSRLGRDLFCVHCLSWLIGR
jgi:hypothetical protein